MTLFWNRFTARFAFLSALVEGEEQKKRAVAWSLLAACLLFALGTPFGWAARAWLAPDSPLAFQPLVPIAAALLFWRRFPNAQTVYRETAFMFSTDSPKLHGNAGLVIGGGVLLVFSYLTQATGWGILGGVLMCVGIVEVLWGRLVRNALAGPLLFLLWMVPPPDSLVARATQGLQVACTAMAGNFLTWLHLPCLTAGNQILLPHYRLEIVGACSGMSILFPLLALTSFLLLYSRQKNTPVEQFGLLGVAAIAAVFLNVARITAMGVLAFKAPGWVARLHDASGWLFTIVGFALVYFLADRYHLLSPPAEFVEESEENEAEQIAPPPREDTPITRATAALEAEEIWAAQIAARRVPDRAKRLAVALFALGCLGVWQQFRMTQAGTWLLPLPATVPMAGVYSGVPTASAPPPLVWESEPLPIASNSLAILGNPRAGARTYRSPLGETVSASVLSAGSFDAYHEPAVCLLGSGYAVSAERSLALPTPPGHSNLPPQTLRAIVFHNTGLHSRVLMLYWLQDADGHTRTDRLMGTYRDWQSRLQTGLQTLFSSRQTCIVRVVVPLDDESSAPQARRDAYEIACAVYEAGIKSGR